MEIIEQIGSYAGLAAILGLAVLATLYFSQARDVRRLRELEQARETGADSARPAEARGQLRPTAAPGPGRPAPAQAVKPRPEGAGAPAGEARPQVAPAGAPAGEAQEAPASQPPAAAEPEQAEPAVTKVEPATAAAGGEGSGRDGSGAEGAVDGDAGRDDPDRPEAVDPGRDSQEGARPAAAAAAGATAAGAQGAAAKPDPQTAPAEPPPTETWPSSETEHPAVTKPPVAPPAASQRGTPPTAPRRGDRPPPPRLPTPRPGAAPATLRSSAASAPPRRGWLAPRYLALIVAGVVVIGAGAAYAVTELSGDGATSTQDGAEAGQPGDGREPFDPSTIEVAVLNGTAVPGLASQIAGSVDAAGFQRGNVANASSQDATAESVVLFADGARRAARQVGQELGIGQIEPVNPESQALAGSADVVVIVGADQAE